MQYYSKRTMLSVGAVFLLLLGGCTLEEAKEEPTPAVSLAETKSMAAASQPASNAQGDHPDHPGHENEGKAPVAPPMAGGPMMADPMAPLTPTPELDTAIKDAEKSGDKKKIGAAYTKRGIFRMTDNKAGARMKYRAALSDLRKALAAVPDQAEAKQAKEQIESIYTSMGRPVPTDDVP